MRHSAWWMRWFAVRGIPRNDLADQDADEVIEFGALTRRGVLRTIGDTIDEDLRPVRRTVWLREHP